MDLRVLTSIWALGAQIVFHFSVKINAAYDCLRFVGMSVFEWHPKTVNADALISNLTTLSYRFTSLQ